MLRVVLASLFAVATLAPPSSVHAWPAYMSSVPNGRNLPFNGIDLGHAEGNMLRNKFGLAFNIPRNWTKALCEADSDGDGQTNGQELGDPCCVWTPGNDGALRTTGISNPGNRSSTTDPGLWKSVDCAAVRQNAPAAASPSAAAGAGAGAGATKTTTTASSATAVLPTGAVVLVGAVALAVLS